MASRCEPYFHLTPQGQRNRYEVCLDRKRLRQRGYGDCYAFRSQPKGVFFCLRRRKTVEKVLRWEGNLEVGYAKSLPLDRKQHGAVRPFRRSGGGGASSAVDVGGAVDCASLGAGDVRDGHDPSGGGFSDDPAASVGSVFRGVGPIHHHALGGVGVSEGICASAGIGHRRSVGRHLPRGYGVQRHHLFG